MSSTTSTVSLREFVPGDWREVGDRWKNLPTRVKVGKLCTVAHQAEAEARRLAKARGDQERQRIITMLEKAIHARLEVGRLKGGDDDRHLNAIDWMVERVRELKSDWKRVRMNAIQTLASRA